MNFKKYEKELNKAGYSIVADQVANSRGDVMGQMDPYGGFHCSDDVLMAVINDAEKAEVEAKKVKKAKPILDDWAWKE